jgi:predicted peptidase
MRKTFTFLLFILTIQIVPAQFQPASYMIKGNRLPYQVLFPENYDSKQQYPLVVFLHGAGERGSDNEKQLVHGKDFLVNNFYRKHKAIVIAPQCPENSYWSNVSYHEVGDMKTFNFNKTDQPTTAMETLMALVDEWVGSGKINSNQVYVGGLSMGGMGTLEIIWRKPDTFAAAFAICGSSNPDKVNLYSRKTAVWLFHGEKDSVVPVDFSRNLYKTLLENNCNAFYTEYPGIDHNSWENVFQEKGLTNWLLQCKKK